MKIAIIQIDDLYSVPPGTLHLGINGWVADQPERLRIHTNLSLGDFMNKVVEQNEGLLGQGELVFAVFDPEGKPVQSTGLAGVKEYIGRILFSPEE